MESISKSTRRLVPALLLGAAALSAAPRAAIAAGAVPPAKPAATSGAAAAPATGGAKETAGPPDGKWLKEKDGREYYIDKLSKDIHFERIDAHKVHTAWGIVIEPVKEDAKFFYFKVYRLVAPPPTVHTATPSPDEVKKIEESYQVDTPESHRLTFSSYSEGLPTQGQWRQGFDLADMNEDGHLDIVHSPARKAPSPPVIFLGDGKGGWRRWREAKFPALPYDYGDAAVGDFNGDGHMDIALGVHLRGLLAMTGDGKGHFKEDYTGLDFVLPGQGRQPGYSSRTIAVTDWNHDGRPDIVAVGEGPRLNLIGRDARVSPNTESYGVVIYLSQPDGTWKRKDQGTSTREIFAESIALGDFNGDHRLDFATGSSVMGKKSLVNYSREDGGWNTVEVEPVRPRAYVGSIDAVDLNGDGLDDLVVGYMSFENATWRSGIDVLYAHKDGTWTRRGLASLERRTPITSISHGDLDGDGKPDLVALTGLGETWVFLSDGKGWFTRETATGIPPYPGGCGGFHVRLADLDGDGKAEIVADFAGENSPANAPDSCPTGGGIQAWHPVLATPRP
jgi:hypothetical protein